MTRPDSLPTCEHLKGCTNKAHRYDAPSVAYLCLTHYLEAVRERERVAR